MNSSIEAPAQGAYEELLNEQRALILAANAGFVDAVAGRLRRYAEDQRVSPRVVFTVGAAALHAAERNPSRSNTRHVDAIGTVLADSALAEPVNPNYDPVSDNHMAVLLESKLSEKTRNPLISLLIGKGAISRGLKQELQIDIPDDAYDAFLADLNEVENQAADDAESGAVGLLEVKDVDPDTGALLDAKTYEQVKTALSNHPRYGSKEIDSLYNQIACSKILDGNVSFAESVLFYDSLRRTEADDGGEEEADAITRLHLALDIKFLHRAETVIRNSYGDYSILASVLLDYQLKTTTDHERYDELRERLDHFSILAFQSRFNQLQPSQIIGISQTADPRSVEEKVQSEAFEIADYSQVRIDLAKLSSEDAPVELKDHYHAILSQEDDETRAKQLFIATVLERLSSEPCAPEVLTSLAKLETMVDSPELQKEIAKIHDVRMLKYANKLFGAAEKREDYAAIFHVLGSIRFLLDDQHPVVVNAKKIYIDSYNRYYGKPEPTVEN